MKALVTGATGFIGSTLVNHLVKADWSVRALVRNPEAARKLLPPSVELVTGDLSNENAMHSAIQGIEVVFHLAGVIAAPSPLGYFETNTQGSLKLAQAALNSSELKRFVFASSVAASGPSSSLGPRTESEIEAPVSDYGRSKLEAEKVLKNLPRLPLTIVRPPIVYGPRDQGLLALVKTVSNRFVPLLPSQTPTREKFYSSVQVDDLCRGLILAAVNPKALGQTFFVTGDDTISSTQMFDVISKSLGKSPLKVRVPRWFLGLSASSMGLLGKLSGKAPMFNRDKLNELLPDYWVVSNSKAKELLGYQPKRVFTEGMAEAVEWYRANSWV